jgi:hypothetical protein
MIRGAQKRIVVIKTADSSVFEEAYFVLKKGRETSEGDMVREANRIIEGVDCSGKPDGEDKRRKRLNISFLLCGMGAGALITALLTGIIALIGA